MLAIIVCCVKTSKYKTAGIIFYCESLISQWWPTNPLCCLSNTRAERFWPTSFLSWLREFLSHKYLAIFFSQLLKNNCCDVTIVILRTTKLSNILRNSPDENLSDAAIKTLSYAKIEKLKSNIDGFLNQVDSVREKLAGIKPKIDMQYKVKKAEMEKPKETRKPGRPPKSSTPSVSQ